MDREDIIRWAREAGDVEKDSRGRETFSFDCYGVERFAQIVAAAAAAEEREACADVCEGHYATDMAARAIRARGEA